MNNLFKSRSKGFTLVELLIAMAIIAVLIAIAAYGIQILQRNARNTRRRKIAQDLQLTAADMQANLLVNPNNLVASGSTAYLLTGPDSATLSYVVRGFNNVAIHSASGATNCSQLEPFGSGVMETSENYVMVGFDLANQMLCVRLEGTTRGFSINI